MTLDLTITAPWMAGLVTWPLIALLFHLGWMCGKLRYDLALLPLIAEGVCLTWFDGLRAAHYFVFGEFMVTYVPIVGTVVTEEVSPGAGTFASLTGGAAWVVYEPDYYRAHLVNLAAIVWAYVAVYDKWDDAKKQAQIQAEVEANRDD